MITPVTSPRALDGAEVIATCEVAASQRTGRTRHLRGGELVNERIARLAIGRYPGEPGVYLFYCDAAWTVITDSLHDSFEGALRQPNFEFDGVTFTQVG